MSDDERALVAAIQAAPDENTARLAYADWLDENGRPAEAEFLKLQLQAVEANARLIELGGQLGAEWLTAVGNVRGGLREIKLRSGRAIRLQNLRQWNFYAGLLAGVPTSEHNRESVQRVVAEEQLRRGELPYLIQPPERPVQRPKLPGGGPWGLLPTIACVGEFDSLDPAKDKSFDGSQLTIIWFQHEFALPIDPGVREQIRAVDWDRHAHDYTW